MLEIERLVVAGAAVGGAELLGSRPGLERRPALPHRVRRVERVVLVLRSLEQVELDEAGHPGEMGVAARPHLLEGLFRALLHAKAVHGDEHSGLLQDHWMRKLTGTLKLMPRPPGGAGNGEARCTMLVTS